MASSCVILMTWGRDQAEGIIVPVLSQRQADPSALYPNALTQGPERGHSSLPGQVHHLGLVPSPDRAWGRPQLWSPRDALAFM